MANWIKAKQILELSPHTAPRRIVNHVIRREVPGGKELLGEIHELYLTMQQNKRNGHHYRNAAAKVAMGKLVEKRNTLAKTAMDWINQID